MNLERLKYETCQSPPHTQTMLYAIFIRKTNLKLDLLNLNIFGSSEYEKMAILKTVKFCFAHKKLFKTINI